MEDIGKSMLTDKVSLFFTSFHLFVTCGPQECKNCKNYSWVQCFLSIFHFVRKPIRDPSILEFIWRIKRNWFKLSTHLQLSQLKAPLAHNQSFPPSMLSSLCFMWSWQIIKDKIKGFSTLLTGLQNLVKESFLFCKKKIKLANYIDSLTTYLLQIIYTRGNIV